MTSPLSIVSVGAKTTFGEVWQWGQELERLHARIAPRFARPEPRRRALAFLKGIVSAIQRKNGWQLAEHAGEARPDGMQRLRSTYILWWSVAAVPNMPPLPKRLASSCNKR
jgi:hypothetical protein